MESNVWEKESLLTDSQGRPQQPIDHENPSLKRRRKALLVTAVLLTNLLSFLVGCSLNWTALASKVFLRRPTSSDSRKDEFFADIDRDTLRTTTFEPFSYEMSNYTAPAGGEIDVDANWEALGATYEAFMIPPSQASNFDLQPEHVLYTPELESDPPGFITEPGYPATMQAIHQIHCLNLIRKSMWFNAEHYRNEAKGSWGGGQSEEVVMAHVGHCLDTMRQVVMCNADTDIVPLYWFTRKGRTIMDFARQKQCRNFESVRAWAEKHEVKAFVDGVVLPPPGVTLADIAGV